MKMPRLNRKLVLEGAVKTPDGAGGYDEVWGDLGIVWANVRPGTGREAAEAGLSVSTVPYRVTLRAAPQGAPSRPVAGQRFRDDLRRLRILAVTEADDDARYLICFAREEVAA